MQHKHSIKWKPAAALFGVMAFSVHAFAIESWGASAGVTSEYFVRGISRSDGHAAVQADIHLNFTPGLSGGLFVSTAQLTPTQRSTVELSPFLGFAWNASDAWRARVMAGHYAYPWNSAITHYDYDEISVDAAYHRWLAFTATYSPSAPRFLYYPGYPPGWIRVAAESLEMNLQTSLRDKLTISAGAGYGHLGGPVGAEYVYWSTGAAYDLAPWSISLNYIDSNGAARYQYGLATSEGRWAATIMRRF
jgi:uncharacterized protein (TIGR02001 family)